MRSLNKKNQSLRKELENTYLENTIEQKILDSAIVRLNNGQKEKDVLKEVKSQFRELALNKKISQKGLSLYTELQRPNRDVDIALSSMTWFQ